MIAVCLLWEFNEYILMYYTASVHLVAERFQSALAILYIYILLLQQILSNGDQHTSAHFNWQSMIYYAAECLYQGMIATVCPS